ncbi:Uncharacterised protein [BD1-7 clade bacterium]|uniref:Uncharacterized protein n=1 Tax=BD1-7 clade bacterium TaxID=2029982 RepID=A0A5S9Q819_9GAMM|nr:Uncharacterised protein [BD1-7 clade bacterium]
MKSNLTRDFIYIALLCLWITFLFKIAILSIGFRVSPLDILLSIPDSIENHGYIFTFAIFPFPNSPALDFMALIVIQCGVLIVFWMLLRELEYSEQWEFILKSIYWAPASVFLATFILKVLALIAGSEIGSLIGLISGVIGIYQFIVQSSAVDSDIKAE